VFTFVFVFVFVVVRFFSLREGGCEVVFRICLFNYDSKGRYHDIKH